jgi:hypothetical protein
MLLLLSRSAFPVLGRLGHGRYSCICSPLYSDSDLRSEFARRQTTDDRRLHHRPSSIVYRRKPERFCDLLHLVRPLVGGLLAVPQSAERLTGVLLAVPQSAEFLTGTPDTLVSWRPVAHLRRLLRTVVGFTPIGGCFGYG